MQRAANTSPVQPPKQKPDISLFVTIIGLIAAVFIPVMQSNGVDVNWQISLLAYTILTGGSAWSLTKHAIPHLSPLPRRFTATLLVFVLGTLGVYAANKQYKKQHPDLYPVLPPPAERYMINRGTTERTGKGIVLKDGRPIADIKSNDVEVDGNLLGHYALSYRVMAVCFHWPGDQDFKDVLGISKSEVRDITRGSILLRIPWSQMYQKEMLIASGTTYAVLLIPKGVSADQISSMRQATQLGGYVLETAGGPP